GGTGGVLVIALPAAGGDLWAGNSNPARVGRQGQPCLTAPASADLPSLLARWATKSATGSSTAPPMSMLPLNFPPSSRMTVGAIRLPRTLPVLVMMIFSL